ncbi:helix-turn-helix transcriptional regulator [Alicyclobacillus mali]|uniref:Helix-turn-helix transcriptional regulator n=1 Tax=Alicyclobacillus mali (ex Roth et al. 2021) TaxID=1123961 RepID=A0ABS0EZU8_9BACL|nr:XRE family transcriptional regulator [Alicyclobacillus mali (ex Roth et al. 2021)]MBF8376578.1 helix-turn-helix transcriptional regulator [Alicyclobacillus mali (ex Roth et al. 2021)]MCL6488299.1 XRE family transcriptional regulator [Alicyclobacillus mali (ex Roth et al. 2021)]
MGFGANVRKQREALGMTLQALSEHAGVSVSMLSDIEREKKSPTLPVACRIAEALDTTLSRLLEERGEQDVIVIRQHERRVYRDPSGFERHLLSPAFPTRGVEWILNVVPPRGDSGWFPPHRPGVEEFVTVETGRIIAHIGDTQLELDTGDSLYFAADVPHRFSNPTDEACRYYLIIDSHGLRP